MGDERDDAVFIRALAVLGLLAVPMTGAGITMALGIDVSMATAILLCAQVAVVAAAFAVIKRRS